MQPRMRTVWGSILVAILLGIGFVPAASAGSNVCVSVNGVNYVNLGTAECYSEDGNTSVAVGDDSYSDAYGSSNTSVSVGDGSYSYSEDGDGSTSVAAGEDTHATTYGGDNNTVVATGYFSYAEVFFGDNNTAVGVGNSVSGYASVSNGDNNTATAIGENSVADIVHGDDNSLTVIDDGYHSIIGENGCFAVVIAGQVYGDEDCLD